MADPLWNSIVGISDGPGSKVAKRLAQAVLPWELRSPSRRPLIYSDQTVRLVYPWQVVGTDLFEYYLIC